MFAIYLALAAPLALLSAGCSGSDGGCKPGEGAELILTTNPSPAKVLANGKAAVKVSARGQDENCDPLPNGTLIELSITDGVGYFSNDETTIGLASSPYGVSDEVRSTETGTATISAFCEKYNLHAVSVEIEFFASQCDIVVSADPAVISADGTSTSKIAATLTAVDGGSVPDNTSVTFSTTAGTFVGGGNTHVATSVGSVATAQLQSEDLAQGVTATITAAVTCGGENHQSETTVEFSPSQCAIALTANPEAITANGLSTSTITATLTADDGGTMPDSTDVTFTTSAGTFEESGSDACQVNPTNSVAVATLISADLEVNVTANIEATFLCNDGENYASDVDVRFTKLDRPTIDLAASPTEVLADDVSASNLTAEVYLTGGTRAGAGELVNFSTDLGRFQESGTNAYQAVTNDNGMATATFIGGTSHGKASIQAQVDIGGQSGYGGTEINVRALGTLRFVSADPIKLGVRGSGRDDTSTITFELLDVKDQPFPAGAEVVFTLSFAPGVSLDPWTDHTDDQGQVTTTLIAGNQATTVTVNAAATVGTVEKDADSPSIAIVGAKPNAEYLTFACEKFNIGGLILDFVETGCTISLADRYSNKIGFTTNVHFRTEAGNITGEAPTSESQGDMGMATVTIRTGNPRPKNVAPMAGEPFIGDGNPRDGLLTIIAATSGEEQFTDQNGNGEFDYTDTNQNGVMDPSEADFTDYTCNQAGHDALVTVTSEPTGANCTAGGFLLQSGVDTDDSGVLELGEVLKSEYVCHFQDGLDRFDAIVNVTDEPTGNNCATGGKKIDAGVDDNQNGQLDPTEPSEPFVDLGEPFIDKDDDGQRDPDEQYMDANNSNDYDGPNGIWDGDTLIWTQTKMVWTGHLSWGGSCIGGGETHSILCPETFDIPYEGSQLFWYAAKDHNLNPLNQTCQISASVNGKGKVTDAMPSLPWKVVDSLGTTMELRKVRNRRTQLPCTDTDNICYVIPVVNGFQNGWQGGFWLENTAADTDGAESGSVTLKIDYRESPNAGANLSESTTVRGTFNGGGG
jgi:hypothetical protein